MTALALKVANIVPDAESIGSRVAKLTKGQVDCLRLVNEHLSSKEIAAELGISPHTVDQRIRIALQTLGVERRTQAARLVAAQAGPYQRLIHQPPHIGGADLGEHSEGAVGIQIRHADRTEGAGATGFETEQRSQPRLPLFLPIGTRTHPRNELSVGARLTWIVIIAIGATFSAGMYLAGLESLSRMLGH
jgi:DNA-binding CsgD family transcriptional regulator